MANNEGKTMEQLKLRKLEENANKTQFFCGLELMETLK